MKYTKYEKARILGARALQLSLGAPIMIKLSDKELEELKYDFFEIAKKELEQDAVPIEIRRPLPEVHREEEPVKYLQAAPLLEEESEEEIEE